MSWEIILSILAIIISIISLLFFSAYPAFKKYLIKKTFASIRNFYSIYKILNPSIKEDKEITIFLINQTIFYYGYPRFSWKSKEDIFSFNPFSFEEKFFGMLSFYEIWKFWYFWRLMNKKIKRIIIVLNKYEYICNDDNKIVNLTYRDSFTEKIYRTSLTICPSFDKMRLFGRSGSNSEYKETKVDLRKYIKKDKKNKIFWDELKSSFFFIKYSI